jgi:hypothetical protein
LLELLKVRAERLERVAAVLRAIAPEYRARGPGHDPRGRAAAGVRGADPAPLRGKELSMQNHRNGYRSENVGPCLTAAHRRDLKRRAVAVVLAFLVILLGAERAAAEKVLAVLVADTGDSGIGADCGRDLDNMQDLFTTNMAAGQLIVTIVKGKEEVTPDRIKEKLIKLEVGKEDTVVFFYAGHGGFDKDRKEQGLDLPGGRLMRKEILELLKAKKPKHIVIITDTCSAFWQSKEQPQPSTIKPEAYIGPAKKTSPLFSSLFLQPSGITDVSSTKPGELAWGATGFGGVFTYSFCKYLRDKQNQPLDWKTVVKQAANTAQDFFTQQFPDGIKMEGNVYKKQTLYSFSLGEIGVFVEQFGVFVKEDRNEVKIVKVIDDSLATKGRLGKDAVILEPGDIILEVSGQRVTTVADFQKALTNAPDQLPILFRNCQDSKNYRAIFSRGK